MVRFLLQLLPAALLAQAPPQPWAAVADKGTVTTRQQITPAGVPAVFEGRVYGVAFDAAGEKVWALRRGFLMQLDARAQTIAGEWPWGQSHTLQGVRLDPATGAPLFSAAGAKGRISLATVREGQRVLLADNLGGDIAGAPAAAARANSLHQRLAVVPLTAGNKLAVVDLNTGRLLRHLETGMAPFGAAIDAAGVVAWVSNWGGRPPRAGELTAPTGLAKDADRVRIDARGVAAGGTVVRIDLYTGAITHSVPTGLHPTALAWDEPKGLLYVANSNSDSVTVVDTKTCRVAATIPIEPFVERAPGLAPTALALGGGRLYVALGGLNAVAVYDTASRQLLGMIPTAWYPSDLALSPDGKRLAVAALLGAGSGWRGEPRRRFVHAYRGSVAIVDLPGPAQLAEMTAAVAANSRLTLAAGRRTAAAALEPWPSPIAHVVFIIKENRTYDQVLGGLGRGNSDPSLVMFGERITPNQHKLAREFVTFDNFYATGGNSADGHQWLTQANEVSYTLLPGYVGRSYPYDGTDPLAYAQGGFLWDAALARRKTVRVYGEYAPRMPGYGTAERMQLFARYRNGDSFEKDFNVSSPIPPLDKALARHFPSYSTGIPDVVRARIFLRDVRQWTAAGAMPNLVLLQLCSNHTNGTRAGANTPQSMVADNDLALGQVVEALTQTPFWRKMAIFVVEDDAQDGVDHVDGHRTLAFVASPYARRGVVDSTFYSHQSMLKTIERMLGLPTLSLFDLIANDLRAAFQDAPDYAPYSAETPRQSLEEINPQPQALSGAARRAALDSAKMRFDVPDAAPTDRLNRILWGATRGWNTPYPGVRRSVFAPLSLDIDDDDR